MKYSRHKVGDRVELVSIDFLQTENGKVISGISGGLHNKQFFDILRNAKESNWNAVEVDYVLIQITKVKSITSSNPIVIGKVLYSYGNVSDEIKPGDNLYIHEDIREFVFDPIISRYIWSNYLINPNKPEIDYGVYCLCEYTYVDRIFRNRSLQPIEKARLAKKMIAEQINLRRTDYDICWTYGKEAEVYHQALMEQLVLFDTPLVVLYFTLTHDVYDSFFDTLFEEISKELGILIPSVSRVTITDEMAGTDINPRVKYRVTALLAQSDYMLLSHDNPPNRNAVFKLIDAKVKQAVEWPSGCIDPFAIKDMGTRVIEPKVTPNDLVPVMRFLFD